MVTSLETWHPRTKGFLRTSDQHWPIAKCKPRVYELIKTFSGAIELEKKRENTLGKQVMSNKENNKNKRQIAVHEPAGQTHFNHKKV